MNFEYAFSFKVFQFFQFFSFQPKSSSLIFQHNFAKCKTTEIFIISYLNN